MTECDCTFCQAGVTGIVSIDDAMGILYNNEINCSVATFWDGGYVVKLGDTLNGFQAETMVNTPIEASVWLLVQAQRLYPGFDPGRTRDKKWDC